MEKTYKRSDKNYMKRVLAFMLAALVISAAAAQNAADAVKVSSPNGAPALSLASLAEKNPEHYTFVAAETISAEFANNKADFIVAPVNAGAKLYKMKKSTYKLAAVVTWGNLYFASQKKNFTISDIQTTGITLFGENTINASVALAALQQNGITPKTAYLGSAAATQTLLLSDPQAVVLTAEPALTAAKIKNPAVTAYAVNDLCKKATGFDGYAQAGLFVSAQLLERNPQAVKDFLVQAEASCKKCTDNTAAVAKAAAALGILPNAKIAQSAIPNCAIRFVPAVQAKKQVEATARIDLKQFGGALPADDFYYGQK